MTVRARGVTLPKGWFMRDVAKAAAERKCYRLLRSLTTEELNAWYAAGRRIVGMRPLKAQPSQDDTQ